MIQPLYIKEDYSIVTIPRVGSHYLQERLYQHTGAFIEKYHTMQDNKIITIARDPKDLLISEVAMALFYDTDTNLNDISMDARVDNHTQLYEALLDSEIIIDYDKLINYPFETIEALSQKLDLPILDTQYQTSLKDQPELKHLVSSKNVAEYDKAKAFVEGFDLSKIYEVYNKLILKSL